MVNKENYTFQCGYKEGYRDAWVDLDPLINAAIQTLKDNLHLCDGDICTLKLLRDAVTDIAPNWEENNER